MKIFATSALVLNWTDPHFWQTKEATDYFKKLDLSEGNSLLQLFSEEENFMHLQVVTGRKYFMRQKITTFLMDLHKKGTAGQVVILAAGIAPLSIEIASLFPSCHVFDVDKFLMHEKKGSVKNIFSNIDFIECDITYVGELNQQLLQAGFDPTKPSLAIMEGIIYYLRTNEFENLLKYFSRNGFALAGDFCLWPELVNEKTRIFATEVFRKIKETVQLDFISFYSEDEMIQLLQRSGFKNAGIINMQQIQEERTGKKFPFESKNSSWLHALYATV